MKKTILVFLCSVGSFALFAQTDTTKTTMPANSMNNNSMPTYDNNSNSINSTASYNAYGTFTAIPPAYVSGYVLRDYPTATDVHWQQLNDWWHGYYMNNGQPVHVYYNTAGNTFTVALPVRQSLVPDDVISKANNMFGPTIYDIASIKGSTGQDIYVVRTLENGQLNSQWIDANGNKVIDVYRDDNAMNTMNNMNMNQTTTTPNTTVTTNENSSMNNSNMYKAEKSKTKTRTPEGKKTKSKTVKHKYHHHMY